MIETFSGRYWSNIVVNSHPYTGFGSVYASPLPLGPIGGPGVEVFMGLPGYGPQAAQAILLAHDLGHAANNAGFPTVVVNDRGNLAQSLSNSAAIGAACFPQGDFGGNQGPVDQGSGAVPAAARPRGTQF